MQPKQQRDQQAASQEGSQTASLSRETGKPFSDNDGERYTFFNACLRIFLLLRN